MTKYSHKFGAIFAFGALSINCILVDWAVDVFWRDIPSQPVSKELK